MGDARALPTAEKALKMRPNDAATIDTMAQIYIEKREFKKAVELLRKATSLAPEDPELRYHLGLALERSGDKIAAKTELSRALSSKKDFVERQSALKALDSIR
jgi:Flp pilus assembly protein TadD